ncbi:GFA family protein [Serratia marcescens]|uniref:GFA family protein n=1 Tax=Serratia marcescens TaxID=615 RepID=UPI003AFAA3BB
MSFQGSCHCGAVTFTVDAELPTEALSCNCSICRRKGLLLSFFPTSAFTLNSGQDQLSTYTFTPQDPPSVLPSLRSPALRLRHRARRRCDVRR